MCDRVMFLYFDIFISSCVVLQGGGGSTHMLRGAGMCRPSGLMFHKKILRHGSHFREKKRLQRGSLGLFNKNCKKNIINNQLF